MTRNARARLESLRFVMNEVYMLGMMAVIAAVLTAAMVMQYAYGELPCPLCLLQRVAMLGVCFGLMQNFRTAFPTETLATACFSLFSSSSFRSAKPCSTSIPGPDTTMSEAQCLACTCRYGRS